MIHTDTDFGNATFFIDDVAVENINTPIFEVRSRMKPVTISGLTQLKKNQKTSAQRLPEACIVIVSDDKVRRYIRYGLNQNKGRPQTDIFLMDKNGKIDNAAPIIWDFDHISGITALPIDQKSSLSMAESLLLLPIKPLQNTPITAEISTSGGPMSSYKI